MSIFRTPPPHFAQIAWIGQAPCDEESGDIYFSSDDGLAESDHVFLNGNDLRARLAAARRFVVAEIGFGFGLNVLALWRLWREVRQLDASVNVLSVEARPPRINDARRALAAYPDLADLAPRLLDAWPDPVRGRRTISAPEDGFTLHLEIGDAATALARWHAEVDAWFLDGFAPDRNPDAWDPDVMVEVARLTRPGGTAATFTAAGGVRRALEAAGFDVERRPGFGRKRHMTCARLTRERTARKRWAWATISTAPPQIRSALVLGGGVAGAAMVGALARRGVEAVWFDDPARPGPSRSNPAALASARLDLDDGAAARLHRNAFAALQDRIGFKEDVWAARGVATPLADADAKMRAAAIGDAGLAMPDAFVVLPAADTDDAIGIRLGADATLHRRAGMVRPELLRSALAGGRSPNACSVAAMAQTPAGWAAIGAAGEVLAEANIAVIAAGALSGRFDATRGLDIIASRGQLTWARAAGRSHHLKVALSAGPYAGPAIDGRHVLGATYRNVPVEDTLARDPADDVANLDAARRLAANAFDEVSLDEAKSFVGLRATTPDRMPLAGAVPDWSMLPTWKAQIAEARPGEEPAPPVQPGLFVLSGLGSRGFVTALYLAEGLADTVLEYPSCWDGDVAAAVHPARFAHRLARRGSSDATEGAKEPPCPSSS